MLLLLLLLLLLIVVDVVFVIKLCSFAYVEVCPRAGLSVAPVAESPVEALHVGEDALPVGLLHLHHVVHVEEGAHVAVIPENLDIFIKSDINFNIVADTYSAALKANVKLYLLFRASNFSKSNASG